MPLFAYTAKKADGAVMRATMTSVTRHEALGALRSQGLTPLALEETGGGARVARAPRRGGRIGIGERAVFCRQLAISVNAGVSLRESLESIADDVDHPPFKRVLADVVERLNGGLTFSECLARHPGVFDDLFVNLVRSAEESGSLPQTLEQLAGALERNQRLLGKLRSITAYPVFIAGFFVLIALVMTLFVLPKFAEVFAGLGSRLPAFTRAVFAANQLLLRHLPLIAAVVVALVAGFMLAARTPRGRRTIHRGMLAFPLVGRCLLKFGMAHFCRNLAMMLRGGVPMTTAMTMSAATSGNLVIEAALIEVRDRLMDGEGMAASMDRNRLFPRLVVRMISVGETSGRLPDVLERVSHLYEEQVENDITVSMALFEPVAIVIFGLITLVLVLAVYIPVFTSAQATR